MNYRLIVSAKKLIKNPFDKGKEETTQPITKANSISSVNLYNERVMQSTWPVSGIKIKHLK